MWNLRDIFEAYFEIVLMLQKKKKKKGKAVLRREVAEMLPRMAILILFLTDGSVAE